MAESRSRADEILAGEARRGSETAFRELVERYERPVYALILRIVRDPSTAEDLAQEAFLRAFRALDRFDPTRKFSSWIFKIAHNGALDHLRRQGLDTEPLERENDDGSPRELPADPHAENPFRELSSREVGLALQEAIASLRPQYREVLELRFGQELSYDEIGEVLGLPLGTVKIHIFRARQELAKRMRALGWDPEELG